MQGSFYVFVVLWFHLPLAVERWAAERWAVERRAAATCPLLPVMLRRCWVLAATCPPRLDCSSLSSPDRSPVITAVRDSSGLQVTREWRKAGVLSVTLDASLQVNIQE